MPRGIEILHSKLMLPYASETIERERLFSLLSNIPNKKLTTVVAGAGYGKTTLIAQAKRILNLKTVWYRLDESDRDFATFLSYLVAGFRGHFPNFGTKTSQRISEIQRISQEQEAILTSFLSEIEMTINEDLVIVIDDYHIIQESREIRKAIEFMLRNLYPAVHVVLISRSEIDLPLSRLKALRELIEIKERDLSFTTDEIAELFKQVFDISLIRESLETIYKRTRGWVSGLILFYHVIKDKALHDIETTLSELSGPIDSIISYLEENVLSGLDDDIKTFLIKTSIFSRMNASYCNELLNIDRSGDILKYLAENHLFTVILDEERKWYAYHHLLKNFLHKKLTKALDDHEIKKLHRDAATLLQKRGENTEALNHYLKADEFKKACDLLSRIGRQLMREERFQLLSSYLSKVPTDYFDDYPWVQYVAAQLLGLSGTQHEAVEGYVKALKCFQKQKDEEGLHLCLIELGLNFFLTGDFQKASVKLEELLNKNPDTELRIEALGYLAYISAYFGNTDKATQYLEDAVSLLPKLMNETLRNGIRAWLYVFQAYVHQFSGNYIKAFEIGKYIEEMIQDMDRYRYFTFHYVVMSNACYQMQRYEEGIKSAEKGLRIIKERNLRKGILTFGWQLPRFSPSGVRDRGFQDTAHPWLLFHSAINLYALGKISDAIQNAKESLRYFKKMGARMGEAAAYNILAGAQKKLGNQIAAEQNIMSGIESIEGLNLIRLEGSMKGNLAELYIESGSFKDALPLLKIAENAFHGSKFAFWVDLLFSRFYWEQGDRVHAIKRLLAVLEVCKKNQLDHWIIGEKKWVIPLLTEVFASGKFQAYIKEILNKIGPDARAPLTDLHVSDNRLVKKTASLLLGELPKLPAPRLKVYLFSKLRLFVGDQEIPPDRWKSNKAKTLFKFLLYSRSRSYMNKEVMMELLWPEQDPQKSAKSFHVALTSLRKTLEPRRSRGIPSSYVSRIGEAYRIDIGDDGLIDTEHFMEELKLAKYENDPEKSVVHYLNAASIYTGDFLEEDLYSDWITEARERFKREYLQAIHNIIEYFDRKRDYEKCIEYARKYVDKDIYAEDIYQLLMIYYAKIGNNAMVIKTFQRCKENIENELDGPLSKETVKLYNKLTSNSSAS